MLRPAYKIKMGSAVFEASGGDVLSINVDCDLHIPLDTFKIVLRPGSGAGAIKKGDETTIELGKDGTPIKVFTGMVDTVVPGITGIVVTGYTAAKVLMAMKVHQIYEKQASGAIVKDLADKAGLKVKDPEDGLLFPMYVVDTSRPAYEHMLEIASLNGFDLFVKPDGLVIFKKYESGKPKPFKYGRDILRSEVNELTPPYTCVKVIGESPASSKGSDKAHWISQGGTGVTSGSGDKVLIVRHPAIRDTDTAEKVAAARMESFLVELGGTITVLGFPKIALGDTIAIKEMPNDKNNGEFEAVRVSHVLGTDTGYLTTIGWIKKVTVSPGEAPAIETPAVPAPPKEPNMFEEMLEKAKEVEEAAKEALIDSVEAAEEALGGILEELQKAMAEVDKQAAEMIKAAGEAKKVAEEAALEALKQVDELQKELREKKKELDKVVDDAEKEYTDYRKKIQEEINQIKEEAKKLEKEADELVKEEEKKLEEAKKAVADQVKPIEAEVTSIKKQIADLENQANDLRNQLPSGGVSVQGSSRDTEKIKQEIEDKLKEAEDQIKDLKKQIEDKLKEAEDLMRDVEDREKEIEEELKGKQEEAKKKLEEVWTKVDKVDSEAADKLKDLEDKVKEAKLKLDEGVKELQDQIDEAQKTANTILKDANKAYNEAVKKVEEGRKEMAHSLESMKSAYKSAREKVMEGKKMAGLE